MRRLLLAVSFAVIAHSAYAQEHAALPSWFPVPAALYQVKNVTVRAYDEFNLAADRKLVPWPRRNSGGYAVLAGRVWRFDMSNPKPDAWTATIEQLQRQGFKFVHGDMKSAKSSASLMKGEGDHATYVAFWQCCNSVAIIEPAPNPFRVTLKVPSSTPESYGAKDDIPFLPPILGSKYADGKNDVPRNINVLPSCTGKSEPFGTEYNWRRYEGPAGLSDFAVRETYEAALRAAGWEPLCESGSHRLDAHFTRNGRDVWAQIIPRVSGTHAGYEITVADAGAGLRAELKKNCKAAVYGVNFDFDKATLRPDADPALTQILAVLKDQPKLALEIGGHTDNIGQPLYNQKLSDARAAAVRQWLIGHGIAASRLSSHGYGDTQPLVPNTTDENRAKNRRVEVKRADCK